KKGVERPFYQGKLNIGQDELSDSVFLKDGEVVRLTDYAGKFIGYAMMSFEQRAYGWVLSTDENVEIGEDSIREKIVTASNKRTPVKTRDDTNVFRLFNAAGGGIGGLSIDNLNGHPFLTSYPAAIDRIRNLVAQVLIEGLPPGSITGQTRFPIDGKMHIQN